MCKSVDGVQSELLGKALDWIRWAATVAVLPVLAFLVLSQIEDGKAISRIEASRFTAEDGLEVWREISDIREALAVKANSADVPPDEVLRALARIERLLQQHINKPDAHQ